jgi:tetratricopeptide (TPR) repeat protein
MQLKDYKKAEGIFSEGLGLFPDDAELNFNMAAMHEKIGRFEDMVKYLRRTIEINPEHADALNYLGYSYADKGINLEEALSLIQKALKLRPDSGYIIDSLGWVYFKMGRHEDAVKALQKATGIINNDPLIYEHLGDVCISRGLNKDALDAWENALKFHEKEEGLKERVEKKIQDLKFKNPAPPGRPM